MKYLKIQRVLFAIFMASFLTSNVQKSIAQSFNDMEGYYVNLTNDTISGYIKKEDPYNLCQAFSFKEVAEEDQYVMINANDCNSFFFGENECYISCGDSSRQDRFFVQELTKGPITLYAYYESNNTIYYLIKQGDAKIYRIEKKDKIIEKDGSDYEWTDKKYQGILALLMQDCPKVKDKTTQTRWNQKSMIKLVDAYNNCVDPSSSYSSDLRKVKVNLGVDLGTLVYGKVSFINNKYSDSEFKGEWGLSIQTYGNIQVVQALFADFGFGYSYHNIHVYDISQNNYHWEDVKLSLHHLDIPLSIRYHLTKTRLAPFLYAHTAYSFILSKTYTAKSNSDELSRTFDFENINGVKWLWGFGIGASYEHKYLIKLEYGNTQYLRGISKQITNTYLNLKLGYLF